MDTSRFGLSHSWTGISVSFTCAATTRGDGTACRQRREDVTTVEKYLSETEDKSTDPDPRDSSPFPCLLHRILTCVFNLGPEPRKTYPLL